MGSRKFGGRKRDNPLSVYFSPEVREQLEEFIKKKGIDSRSKVIEVFVKEGLNRITKDKALEKAVEGPNPLE